ncbi:MAG: flagellar hook protein FlgE [Bdellovibrionota bacterium]
MSLYSSMATSISGLEANGQKLSVVSDNIVNANTHGYKAARGEFQNFVAQNLLTDPGQQIGRGVTMAGVTTLFTQGAISTTDRNTDVAVNGNGFFVLRDGNNGTTFTRDGSFRFDRHGWLTTLGGQRVQAYQANTGGTITGKLADVRIPQDTMPAKQSHRIQIHANLDARAKVHDMFDLERPQETAQFSTATQMYDSLGNQHGVSMFFNKTDDGTWEWTAMADGAELESGKNGEMLTVARGLLVFDSKGRLEYSDQQLVDTTFTNGAVPDQKLVFDFGDALDDGGTGVKGSTQYGAKNAVFRNVQDGHASGVLLDVNIDEEGIISGVYSNGASKALGQMAIARFEATDRLRKIGKNQFRETVESGGPLVGRANTNGRGTVVTRALERSNVDLAEEFVEMLRAQRGFQASAKSIHTANEMLDEVIALGGRR